MKYKQLDCRIHFFFCRKLISFYEELTTEFEKVSQFFKFGNLKLFQRDMTNYYTDLQFTKGKCPGHNAKTEVQGSNNIV